ncbi:MAG: hypothetical protein PHQ93_07945 [Sulfurimonas sp.]|uniref:hypothetical protein n=1 Tax=Sulfurimonas sp. TaxID=2022749 RepID=UPI00262D5CA0|nr:hypothetical protein [Sulfurimonas sp.]MDD5401101.1 hypothetical protein [Sulfurimonas sp.]
MRLKFQIAFFVTLFIYLAILFSGEYVSVYYTYYLLPLLAFLALFAFGSLRKINQTAKLVFVLTLFLLILTLATVSYVGAYLPTIVGIIFMVSGIIMYLTKKKG